MTISGYLIGFSLGQLSGAQSATVMAAGFRWQSDSCYS